MLWSIKYTSKFRQKQVYLLKLLGMLKIQKIKEKRKKFLIKNTTDKAITNITIPTSCTNKYIFSK